MTDSVLRMNGASPAEWLPLVRRLPVEDLLLPVLIQLCIILLAARLFAMLGRRLRQPAVVGEIVAGLLLGPSVFGRLFPSLWLAIFHPTMGELPPEVSDILLNNVFTVLSQIGLIFLLFLVGLEFDFSHLRWHGKSALAISVAGVALPFVLGVGLGAFMWPRTDADGVPVIGFHPGTPGKPVPELGFLLFMGLAMSITAIPVLGRMMMELNITRTRLGAIVIAAAAVDDATGWILLAAIAAVVNAHFSPERTALMVVETIAFAVVMIVVVRPLLRWWLARLRTDGKFELGPNTLAVLLVVIFLCAIATNLIGIFAIFGAFFLGAVLSSEEELRQAVTARLRDLFTVFFLPIFFTYTGLRTDIGSLTGAELWLFCALVLAAAIVGKIGGCGVAAWCAGLSAREAGCVGILMNTRGLMELVVINLGYELRVIPPSVFCMLVIMALVTTLMTTPLLLRAMPGTELEAYVRQSGFARAGGAGASAQQS